MGISKANMNPPLTMTHAGWGAQTHIAAEGIESDFWSKVIVLSDDRTTAVLVDLDTCVLQPEQALEMRQRLAHALNLQISAIRISTTHTHAGPLVHCDYYEELRPARLSYFENMIEQTVGAALQAKREQVQVTVGAGYGYSNIAKNRRQWTHDGRIVCGVNEQGLMDPTVGVLRFDDEAGCTVASIVQYAMHPTLLGPDNRLASPDYPGVVKQVVEQLVGGTCLFLQGATGDVGPGKWGFKANVRQMRTIGRMIGSEASRALLDLSTYETVDQFDGVIESGASLGYWSQIPVKPNTDTLGVFTKDIRLPVSAPMPPMEAKEVAGSFQAQVEELQKNGGSDQQIRDAMYQLKRADMVAKRCELFYNVDFIDVEAHCIRIGDAVLIGMPIEPFSRIGIAIREQSPFPCTLFGGYSNGWIGYLPTEDAYERGGYEVLTSPFVKGAAEQLISEVADWLNKIDCEKINGR